MVGEIVPLYCKPFRTFLWALKKRNTYIWPRATPSSPKDYGERHPWTPFPLFCSGSQDDNHGSSFSRIFNFSVSFFRIIFYLNLKNSSRRKSMILHVTSSSSLPIHCQTWYSLPSCWPMHHRPLVTLSPSWPVLHWPQLFPRSSIPKLAGAPPGRNSSPPYLNIFFVRDLRECMNV